MKIKRFFLLIWWWSWVMFSQNTQPVEHIVKEGETIYSIARQYRVTPYKIIKTNPGLTENIRPGDVIVIPPAEAVDTLALSGKYAGFKYHTVKENETIFSISRQYNTTIEDIIKVNKIEDNNIKLGQIIIIPLLYDPHARIDTTRYTTYVVKPKEGKWRVAYEHGITVDELERLNPEIQGKPLQVNQRLIVPRTKAVTRPAEDENYVYYEVKPLETLYSLTKKFGVSQEELIRLNPELADGLKAGQVLKIPRQPGEKKTVKDKFSAKFIYHEVLPKETVYGITKRYNVSIEELMKHNPELKDGLKAGMILRIPRPPFRIVFDIGSPLFFRIEKILSPEEYTVNLLNNLDKTRRYKFALLLPLKLDKYASADECSESLMSNKVVDYYAGIRAAVDSLRSLGVRIDYDVFDTKGSEAETEKILLKNDLSEYDFVLGPLYKQPIRKTLEGLVAFNTPVVVPSFKSVSAYPNLVQTSADSTAMAEHMLSYIESIRLDDNVVVVYDEKAERTADTVAVRLGTVNKLQAHKSKHGYWVRPDDLKKLLSPYRKNHIVLATKDMSLIANVLAISEGFTGEYELQTYNLEKIKNPETFDIKKMAATGFHFPSRSLLIPDPRVRKYTQEKYGLVPTQPYINGFDTVFDLVLRLGNAENLFEGLKKFGKTKESAYIYLYGFRPQSGFKNIASYIIRINEHLEPEAVD